MSDVHLGHCMTRASVQIALLSFLAHAAVGVDRDPTSIPDPGRFDASLPDGIIGSFAVA